MLRPPPISPLFPYTTLFRSRRVYERDVRRPGADPGPGTIDSRDDGAARFQWLAPALVRPATPRAPADRGAGGRSEEHTSELQSRPHLVCRLLLEKKNEAIMP